MKINIKVYEGNKPYIFISYAHKNKEEVIPIIKAISDRAYRIWYDSGVKSGENYCKPISERLAASNCVVCFLSEAFCDSYNCCNELIFALNKRLPVMVIYLERFSLPDRMELLIAQNHALYLDNYEDFDQFIEELERSDCFSQCSSAGEIVDPAEHLMKQGEMYMSTNPGWAREAYRRAIDAYKVLSGLQYEMFLPNMATANHHIGQTYIKEERYNDALEFCKRALELFLQLNENTENAYTSVLAELYFDLCVVYHHLPMLPQALNMAEKSLEIYEMLCQDDIATYGKALSDVYLYLSDFHHSLKEKGDMEAAHRKAIALLETLSTMDRSKYTQSLADACYRLGLRIVNASPEEAMSLCERALAIYESLCADDAETFESVLSHMLWEVAIAFGEMRRADKKIDEIITAAILKAIGIYEKLEEERPCRYRSCIKHLRFLLLEEQMEE